MAHTGFEKLEIIHGENDILCAYIRYLVRKVGDIILK